MSKLKSFIKKNSGKPVIAVQGLGFVGSVMSLVCANSTSKEYAVIGIDLPNKNGKRIIQMLNQGKFPLKADDPKIPQFFKTTLEKKNFFATTDINGFVYADVIIVDINLDVKKKNNRHDILDDYDVDMSHFSDAIKSIGDKCKEDALILIETTVPPGTCNSIVKPIIFDCLKKRGLSKEKIKIGHSYERVMPGPNYIDSIKNFYRVYSGIDKKSEEATEEFLKTIISTDKFPLTKLKSTNSTEIAKVLENSYRAMNIAFMVEWSRFAEESDVDLYEVIDAIRLRPTHSNMMYPGIGVGGYCLTKDALLASWSRKKLFSKDDESLSYSENAVRTNDQMPKFAYEYLTNSFPNLKSKNILLLGISYRGDIGDTRYSPVEKFYDYLINLNCNIYCHDPFINFWNEKSLNIFNDFSQLKNKEIDVVILCSAHTVYNHSKTIDAIIKIKPKLIYDTLGFFSNKNIHNLRLNHKLLIIGRGDIKIK